MTVKQFIAVSTLVVGTMTAFIGANTYVVVPSILRETSKDTKELLKDHSRLPHNGAATRLELRSLKEDIRSHEAEVIKRLERIESRIMNGAGK